MVAAYSTVYLKQGLNDMKNRAKCRLCNSIIESFHSHDYVECKCGEIAVDAGDGMRCYARDFSNFLRVDDERNEIIPKVIAKDDGEKKEEPPKLSKEDLVKMLDEMVENIERLPTQSMTAPITHYDFVSLLLLLSSIFKS